MIELQTQEFREGRGYVDAVGDRQPRAAADPDAPGDERGVELRVVRQVAVGSPERPLLEDQVAIGWVNDLIVDP